MNSKDFSNLVNSVKCCACKVCCKLGWDPSSSGDITYFLQTSLSPELLLQSSSTLQQRKWPESAGSVTHSKIHSPLFLYRG